MDAQLQSWLAGDLPLGGFPSCPSLLDSLLPGSPDIVVFLVWL